MDIDVENGLSSEQVERHREQYGTNAMESAPMKWFLVLFVEAFDDQVLWVLMAAAAVSLILSFVPHYEPLGYIEGLAICCRCANNLACNVLTILLAMC